MRLLEEIYCTSLRHENCQRKLSCTLQNVTRPSEITAISFSSLFAKEDKRKRINIQYEVRKITKKRTTKVFLRFIAHG
jgi:hypothetical protein